MTLRSSLLHLSRVPHRAFVACQIPVVPVGHSQVLATCGVTSSGRRARSRSRAREGVLEGLPPSIFNFAMRDVSVKMSTLC